MTINSKGPKSNQIREILKSYSDPLPVMEHFYTIQGEGQHSGKASYFIRLAGCDIGCVWCDVKDSWGQEGYPLHTVSEISSWVKESKTNMVVITGGEPLMHNLDKLCTELKTLGVKIHLETSGAHDTSGDFDWICLSPKKFGKPVPATYSTADELKIIVYNNSDFEWAEEQAAYVNETCVKILQPEWGKAEQMLPAIIDYVKKNPKWRISLQTHKFMNIP